MTVSLLPPQCAPLLRVNAVECIEAVMRQRGRFGPSTLACMQAALSRLPSEVHVNTGPRSTTASIYIQREGLDVVDAEAFLLCFYEECSAVLRVLSDLQCQSLRTHKFAVDDYEEAWSASTKPYTENGHQKGDTSNVDSIQYGKSNEECQSKDSPAAKWRPNTLHQVGSGHNLQLVKVCNFFHQLMDSDILRTGTISILDFQRTVLYLHEDEQQCCLIPATRTSPSTDVSILVEAVKRNFACGRDSSVINYVRLWITVLSHLEEAQGRRHGCGPGPLKDGSLQGVEKGMTLLMTSYSLVSDIYLNEIIWHQNQSERSMELVSRIHRNS